MDNGIRDLYSVSGSGVTHNDASGTTTFESFDLTGLSYGDVRFVSFTGTIAPDGMGNYDFDLSVTIAEGPCYRMQFIYDFNPFGPTPATLEVTVNGELFSIPRAGPPLTQAPLES
jgi:hypothetical protein